MAVDKVFAGNHHIAQVRKGSSMQFPSPVKDGLMLWYDFMGRKNSDAKRGIVEDLSGNGNDGTLTNFAHTAGSGYEDKREIEGRNLLRDNYRILANNQTVAAHFLEEFEGHYRIKAILTPSGTYGGISTYLSLVPGLGIPAGNTTTSILVKPESDCRIGIVNDATSYTECKAGKWTKLIARHTTAIDRVVWGLISTTTPVDSWIEFKDFKLELGTEATPWRPAMEDPEYEEWAKDKGFKRHLMFDGADDYITFPNKGSFRSDGISFETTIDIPSGGTYKSLISARTLTSDFIIFPTSTQWVIQPSSPNDRVSISDYYGIHGLKHLIITITNSQVRVFIDGTLKFQVDGVYNLRYGDMFYIGRDASSQYYVPGPVMSTKLYNRALTPEEVTHNYQIEKERWGLE